MMRGGWGDTMNLIEWCVPANNNATLANLKDIHANTNVTLYYIFQD